MKSPPDHDWDQGHDEELLTQEHNGFHVTRRPLRFPVLSQTARLKAELTSPCPFLVPSVPKHIDGQDIYLYGHLIDIYGTLWDGFNTMTTSGYGDVRTQASSYGLWGRLYGLPSSRGSLSSPTSLRSHLARFQETGSVLCQWPCPSDPVNSSRFASPGFGGIFARVRATLGTLLSPAPGGWSAFENAKRIH